MPIRINLLAEAQAAEDLRRRDPVKRVIVGGVLALALMVAWYSYLELKVMIASRELSRVQIDIDSHAGAFQSAVTNEAEIAKAKVRLEALNKLEKARLLQGNLLNALQKVSVDNVQLTRIRVDESYVVNGRGGKIDSVTEKDMVTLDARDASPNPGDSVGKFKDALARAPYFIAMLGRTNSIRLADESAPQQDNNGKNFVSFTLECNFPDKTR